MLAELKGLNEECGLFGIWGHSDAAQVTYYGLHSLQHRGQEGTGMVLAKDGKLISEKGEGLVTEVLTSEKMESLSGDAAIGHVRYTGAGDRGFENVQPLLFNFQSESMAMAHNGSLVNAKQLRAQLEEEGSIFHSTSDTEILAHLIRKSKGEKLKDRMIHALNALKGAYAFLTITDSELLVASDPNGLRPLSLGMLGGAYVVASETCALDIVGAEFIRDIEPGELLVINDEGMTSERFATCSKRSMCTMEYIYFSRPDSNIDGINVHTARKSMGKQLAIEKYIEADVVTGVPDSGNSAAIGYAEASGLPYEMGLIKNRYVGRTFIQPSQSLREQGVKMKLSAVRGVVEGKRVVMIDDSIVRGTTSKRIVTMLKDAGAKEVHVLISSPPIKNPCFYGIDTSTQDELIASKYSVEEMLEIIGADSLTFLSVEGMIEAIDRPFPGENRGQCLACFNGDYPTEISFDEQPVAAKQAVEEELFHVGSI